MQFHSSRNAGDFVAQRSEAHAPGQVRRFSPAATGGETTLPAENVAERDPRRAGIGSFPPGQLPAAHQNVTSDQRAQQSTVKNAAGTKKVQRDELHGVFTILRLSKEHQQFRSHQRRQQQPQAQIINPLFREPIALGESDRDKNRAQKGQRQKHAIGVDGKVANAKKYWIHEPSVVSDQWSVISSQW